MAPYPPGLVSVCSGIMYLCRFGALPDILPKCGAALWQIEERRCRSAGVDKRLVTVWAQEESPDTRGWVPAHASRDDQILATMPASARW
jgi:hypothetical protein